MPVSDKFIDIKFTKSITGYSTSEVDGFINDVLPLIKEQEQQLKALRVKLEAFEAQRDSVAEKEQKAYKLLEAAKNEAGKIIESAKKKAEELSYEAQLSHDVQIRSAESRASSIINDAEISATGIVRESMEKAEKIISDADSEARATIEKVRAYSEEEKRKVQALSNECYNFETRFRTLVAETAKAFAEIKEQTPLKPTVAEVPVQKAEEEKPQPEAEEPKEEPKEESIAEPEAVEPETVTDIEIAGGKPVVKKSSSDSPKKHFYDTVNVMYDDSSDDEFEDIRDIMSRMGKRKSPTDFSE